MSIINKPTSLILIDLLIGSTLLPFGYIFGKLKKIIPHKKTNQILVIKFLGAGNFIAINQFIKKDNISIITSSENKNAIYEINSKIKLYFINHKNTFKLISSVTKVLSNVLFCKYQQIINLESESKFAKFLCSVIAAKKKTGITNIHKSYLDHLIYDYYIVNHPFLDKNELLNLLTTHIPSKNTIINDFIQTHIQRNDHLININKLNKIVIAPTCSKTDYLRRLSFDQWNKIIQLFNNKKSIQSIEILFSNSDDSQYQDFNKLKDKYTKVDIKITQYQDFVFTIKKADLLLCIDSQALHLGQQFNKKVICFYGPTSPFAINLAQTTIPIYQSLSCSPCTHKYHQVPCLGKAPCMQFKIKPNTPNLKKIFT